MTNCPDQVMAETDLSEQFGKVRTWVVTRAEQRHRHRSLTTFLNIRLDEILSVGFEDFIDLVE